MLSRVGFLKTSVLVVGIFAVVLGPGSQTAEAVPPPFDFFVEFLNELGLDPAECVVSPDVLRKKCKQKKIDKKISKASKKVDKIIAKLAGFDPGDENKIEKQNEKFQKRFDKLLEKICKEIGLDCGDDD